MSDGAPTKRGPVCGTDHPTLARMRHAERSWDRHVRGWAPGRWNAPPLEDEAAEFRHRYNAVGLDLAHAAALRSSAERARDALTDVDRVALVTQAEARNERPVDALPPPGREAASTLVAAPGAPSLRVPATA